MAKLDREQSFERSLERCLQDLERTGDIEACLRRYSQHAEQLRPLLEMAQLARHHYKSVPEPPNGLVSGRERLLAAAAQQRARATFKSEAVMQTTKGQRGRLAFAMRFVGVLLAIVIGTMTLGGGIVWAANDSLPGDALYPVKAAVEDARLALASVPQDQVDLALEFVEERVEEIQDLVEIERPVPDEAIARMELHIEQALVYAAQISSDQEMVDALGQITTRTRTQAGLLEQMQFTAPQQTRTMLMQATAVCRQGVEAAEIGLGDPQTFRLRYHHQQGTPELTSEPRMMTVTPGHGQEQHQECGRGRECTPTTTQSMTRQGPQTTQPPNTPQAPQPSPQRPQSTPKPQHTPQNPNPTPKPQPSPQNPKPTPEPQPTSQNPQATPHKPQTTPNSRTTPSGSHATPSPQTTPQGSQATPKSQPTPQGP